MKKKAKKNSGFSDVINNVTAGLKKYVPIYTKKMGKAAQDYGQIGLDNIDIQVYKNKIKKITTQIGEFVLNSSPQLNFSGNKKIQKMIKEIDKLQKKIKEKEKHKK
ncbi:MAG TPA: hypothetical protein VKS21_02125, partial [Spirochaetota bacterium]|nr:hypothetical protein [Spirochaetota bacterium]